MHRLTTKVVLYVIVMPRGPDVMTVYDAVTVGPGWNWVRCHRLELGLVPQGRIYLDWILQTHFTVWACEMWV